MKPIAPALILVLSASAPASAQTAGAFMANPAFKDPPPKTCDTTFDMQHCTAHELRMADAFMGKSYRAALAASTAPGAAEKLRQAQRSWLAYRDQTCIWQGALNAGGTIAPVVVGHCWVELTKARDTELAAALQP